MIYEPRLAFDLRLALLQGVIQAGILALGDFIAAENKPWSYYAGAALGYAAGATGIPNAAATMYVVGEAVDLTLFHSPDGSDVDVFLDGILVAQVDTYTAGGSNWQALGLTILEGIVHRIDIVNTPSTNVNKTSTINWMGLGAVTVTGNGAQMLRSSSMAYDTISYRLADAEGGRLATFPFRVVAGLTRLELQGLADDLAPLLDAITAAKIQSVSVELGLDVTAGVKAAPNALSLNERGGLITFLTDGPRRDSVWVPAILPAIAPGEGEFAITAAGLPAFIAQLISAGRTANDNAFVSAQRASRSLRK